MYLALVILAGGCSGINVSKSVSPLDFFLPGSGLLRADPMPVQPDGVPPTQAPLKQVAQN